MRYLTIVCRAATTVVRIIMTAPLRVVSTRERKLDENRQEEEGLMNQTRYNTPIGTPKHEQLAALSMWSQICELSIVLEISRA